MAVLIKHIDVSISDLRFFSLIVLDDWVSEGIPFCVSISDLRFFSLIDSLDEFLRRTA